MSLQDHSPGVPPGQPNSSMWCTVDCSARGVTPTSRAGGPAGSGTPVQMYVSVAPGPPGDT